MEWTELAPQSLIQPQGGVGVADAEEEVARVADAEEEDVAGAENALPGPIAIAPRQGAEAEPGTRYPRCDRHMPDCWSMDALLPQKRGRKK